MRFIGKAKNEHALKLIKFDDYFSSFKDKNNDLRLGMTYLKPGSKGEILSGINVFVTYGGIMMPYGGVNDIYADIYKDNYSNFIERLLKDIVSRTLLFDGLDSIKRVDEEIDTNITERIRKKNWIASIADESLSTPEKRLYITIRLLQKKILSGEIKQNQLSKSVQNLLSVNPEIFKNIYLKYMNTRTFVKYEYGNELSCSLKNIKNLQKSAF